MSRVFDHLVLAVDDLDQATEFFERIGFTLTPRAQHPFGTGNRLAQRQGCFLEVLGITKPEDVTEADPGAFSFGAYNRDYLTRGQGLSMIVMQTIDAAADRNDFKSRDADPRSASKPRSRSCISARMPSHRCSCAWRSATLEDCRT